MKLATSWAALAGVALIFSSEAKTTYAQETLAKLFDRSPYFGTGARTTDDLRRVPLPQEDPEIPVKVMIITHARLFDGTGAAAHLATILIRGEHIDKILPDAPTDTKGATVIDAGGRTVMPGLIDLHTHLTYVGYDTLDNETGVYSQADAALRGVERLRYFLESGITTVRDVGSHGEAPFRLKSWVTEGRLPGPRIFAAGQLITGYGGHATEYFFAPTAPKYPDAYLREASGPDDWREAVREQFKRGADLIKVASHFSKPEVAAAIDEAHHLGLRVTCDCETQYTQMAVEAGIDGIEHPLPRSDETVRMMAERHVASVPTLVSYQYLLRVNGGYWGMTSRRFTLTNDTNFAMAKKLKDAGVKLGVGTDLTVDWFHTLPDAYISELHNFERLGDTPAQALVAATRTNAEILGMDDKLGTLSPGKLADLIIVAGKPDANLDDLRGVDTVIVDGRIEVKDGRLYLPRHETAKPPSPRKPSL